MIVRKPGKGLEDFTLVRTTYNVKALVHFIVSEGEDIVNQKVWHRQVKSGGAPNVSSRTCYWVKLPLLFSQLSFV